jgi:hypothetical protein
MMNASAPAPRGFLKTLTLGTSPHSMLSETASIRVKYNPTGLDVHGGLKTVTETGRVKHTSHFQRTRRQRLAI